MQEANSLTEKVTIVSLPEEYLWRELRQIVSATFQLGSHAVDVYILVLVASFLQWATERKEVTRTDLDQIRVMVGEHLARESQFEAYGRGLVQKISWDPDRTTTDFFEGKGTRPGHIAADDVRRPHWLERIDRALRTSRICILRSSSGQGKSTLLYRYAYEHWPVESTFVLRAAESQEHVEVICNYLRFQSELGLPVYLLIEEAGWRTRLWPLIVQECTALGIPVLVAIRQEDWYRFTRQSVTNFEVLEPILDQDEARQIFHAFRAAGRLHSSVDSPDWAYEKIGEPHVLMEYVYLLTHGHMLEERLRDQVKQFSEQQEDPAKVEILRRTALASVLGAPVRAENLLQDLPLRDDAQLILQSLAGEYLTFESGELRGLHWVRSEHLTRILYEGGYPDLVKTALAVLEAVPSEYLSVFAANVLSMPGLDHQRLLKGLAAKAGNTNLDTLLTILDGIFEAGERRFFQANQGVFDEAYTLVGRGSLFLLTSTFLPVGKTDLLGQLANMLGDKGQNLIKLQKIVATLNNAARGFDLCRGFLQLVNPEIRAEVVLKDLAGAGCILDWCALCGMHLPAWPSLRESAIGQRIIFDLPLQYFRHFLSGRG